jgi:hypothetical protein
MSHDYEQQEPDAAELFADENDEALLERAKRFRQDGQDERAALWLRYASNLENAEDSRAA